MSLDIFARQLQLIDLLTGNIDLGLDDICTRLAISRRTFLRYISMLRQQGFDIQSRREVYTLDPRSAFFNAMSERMQLSYDEALTLTRLLDASAGDDPLAQRLRRRLAALYGIEATTLHHPENDRRTSNISAARQAISQRLQVVLHGYESVHSHSLSDRLVEPYRYTPGDDSLYCYELSTQLCKVFKISRVNGIIEVLDAPWEHTQQHLHYHTDIFGFSSTRITRVGLRVGPLATRILCEEFGVKDAAFILDADGTHRLITLSVCGFKGIGRFVLGLMHDIEITRNEEFRQYLRAQLQDSLKRLAPE